MYLGDLFTHNSGYRGYNTHSQFLESLLVNGIPGGILFLFICYALVRMTGRSKQGGTRLALVLLLGYAFLESVFETQYAIVLFSFFPCFLSAEEPEPTFPQPKPISKGMNP